MKESHEKKNHFPKELVRLAIQSGVVKAKEQTKDNKIKYKHTYSISDK